MSLNTLTYIIQPLKQKMKIATMNTKTKINWGFPNQTMRLGFQLQLFYEKLKKISAFNKRNEF